MIQTTFLISFLVLFSIIKNWLSFDYWLFWLGGVVGSFLSDLDQLIYIFFMESQEVTSQRVIYLIRNKEIGGAIRLLFETQAERTNLVFHSNFGIGVILILTFWIMTSSASLIGNGLVLGMAVHLLIDRFQKALYHGPV